MIKPLVINFEWFYHTFLYSYLYTNCFPVTKPPDEGNSMTETCWWRIQTWD